MGSIKSLSISNKLSEIFTTNHHKPSRTTGRYLSTSSWCSCGLWLINPEIINKDVFFAVILLFFANFSLFSQSAVPLASELSRLERVSISALSRERYDAYMSLAQIHRLSGNPEAALKACEGALALFPGDGKALLEQARLLISLGEYEKASAAAAGLLRPEQEKEFFLAGRYLYAQAEAFLSGNIQSLAALAAEPDFSGYLGAIYYTIWRLSDLSSYRNRLTSELPLSPEAGIAGGKVIPAATPLWLLFPGRDSIASPSQAAPAAPIVQPWAPATPVVQPWAPQTPAPQPAPQPSISQAPVPQTPASQTPVLQTGLFSQAENAQTQANNLKKAGFTPEIFPRQVNGANYWAVCVPYGSDMNSMVKRLKDAGFDSFPINR